MRQFQVQFPSGGEIQVTEYEPGEPLTLEDRVWDDVAYQDTTGGFSAPHEVLDQDFIDSIIARERHRKREGKKYDQEFIAAVASRMLVIDKELAEQRSIRERQARSKLEKVIGRLFSRT